MSLSWPCSAANAAFLFMMSVAYCSAENANVVDLCSASASLDLRECKRESIWRMSLALYLRKIQKQKGGEDAA